MGHDSALSRHLLVFHVACGASEKVTPFGPMTMVPVEALTEHPSGPTVIWCARAAGANAIEEIASAAGIETRIKAFISFSSLIGSGGNC